MAQETVSEVSPAEAQAELTDESRDALATELVDRYSLYSGAAGLIPIPWWTSPRSAACKS